MSLAAALISPVLLVIVGAAFLFVLALLAAAMVLSYRLRATDAVPAERAKRRVSGARRRQRGGLHARSRQACARGRGRWTTERARR